MAILHMTLCKTKRKDRTYGVLVALEGQLSSRRPKECIDANIKPFATYRHLRSLKGVLHDGIRVNFVDFLQDRIGSLVAEGCQ